MSGEETAEVNTSIRVLAPGTVSSTWLGQPGTLDLLIRIGSSDEGEGVDVIVAGLQDVSVLKGLLVEVAGLLTEMSEQNFPDEFPVKEENGA